MEPGDLARARDARPRAGDRAGAEGSRAAPKNAAYWDTLGVALYRSGDWDQAAEALGRSRELLGKDEPRAAFFLAMAHWRQGDREKARVQFKRAVAAAGERGLRDDEVNRFHAEAAALIDSKPPPSRQPEK